MSKTNKNFGILSFMSRMNFMLSSVEHENIVTTSRFGHEVIKLFMVHTAEIEISTAHIESKTLENNAFTAPKT